MFKFVANPAALSSFLDRSHSDKYLSIFMLRGAGGNRHQTNSETPPGVYPELAEATVLDVKNIDEPIQGSMDVGP